MPHYDVEKIISESTGKWRGIVENLGISVPESPMKHGPCPICGPGNNSHRFRFDDKDGAGTWICNQCGAGNGWSLLQQSLGLTFIDAIGRVSEIVGGIEECTQESPKKDPSIALKKLWVESKPIDGKDCATKYLRSRGCVFMPQNIRYSNSCYDFETKTKMDALIGVVMDSSGKCISLHRTYLKNNAKAEIESPRKMMTPIKPLAGSAIRLFEPKDKCVGIAEGIETAICASQLFDIPTWSCLNASLLESFEPPEGIRKVVIFGDNDASFTGQKSAYRLANRLYIKDYIVDVQIPENQGDDWADVMVRNLDIDKTIEMDSA